MVNFRVIHLSPTNQPFGEETLQSREWPTQWNWSVLKWLKDEMGPVLDWTSIVPAFEAVVHALEQKKMDFTLH